MPGTRKLGRDTAHRTAMLRAMVTFLLENGKIETTVTRAKEVRSLTEKMITIAKENTDLKEVVDTVLTRLIEDGVRFDFYFEREGFLIPLEITLTDEGIRAAVPLADIQEQSSAVKLTTISPLPNFGAGREGEQECWQRSPEGFLYIPSVPADTKKVNAT